MQTNGNLEMVCPLLDDKAVWESGKRSSVRNKSIFVVRRRVNSTLLCIVKIDLILTLVLDIMPKFRIELHFTFIKAEVFPRIPEAFSKAAKTLNSSLLLLI